jgi:hypothetical protein
MESFGASYDVTFTEMHPSQSRLAVLCRVIGSPDPTLMSQSGSLFAPPRSSTHAASGLRLIDRSGSVELLRKVPKSFPTSHLSTQLVNRDWKSSQLWFWVMGGFDMRCIY